MKKKHYFYPGPRKWKRSSNHSNEDLTESQRLRQDPWESIVTPAMYSFLKDTCPNEKDFHFNSKPINATAKELNMLLVHRKPKLIH